MTPPVHPNYNAAETDFLDQLRAGDRAALNRMVEEYSPQVYRVALRMLGSPADAEDALQETFLKVLRALPDFEGRSSLSTWIYRIAVNESLMLIRKRRPDTLPVEDEYDDSDEIARPLQLTDWCCLPEQEFTDSETRRLLDEAVTRLSPALRAVFILRDVQGLSVRETAEALTISESAVKVRLLRARLNLRETLSSYFGERAAAMKGATP